MSVHNKRIILRLPLSLALLLQLPKVYINIIDGLIGFINSIRPVELSVIIQFKNLYNLELTTCTGVGFIHKLKCTTTCNGHAAALFFSPTYTFAY